MTAADNVAYTFGQGGKAGGKPNLFWLKRDGILSAATGDQHTGVVTKKGRLFMFGDNSWGQLGLGNKEKAERPACVKGFRGACITQVACGRAHTLAAAGDGKLFAFGENSEGQLGLGTTDDTSHPQPIAMPSSVKSIRKLACGSEHSAALLEDGRLFMWGCNTDGQSGGKEGQERFTKPHHVELPFKVDDVACGYYHTALVSADNGQVYTCGESDNGQLGHELGNYSFHLVKGIDSTLPRFSRIACGNGYTVASTMSGEVHVFGDGAAGQLGMESDALPSTAITQPRVLSALVNHRVTGIACGDCHTAVLTDSGKVFVFGDGRDGKLGSEDGCAVEKSPVPKEIPSLADVFTISVACGGCHTVVIGRKQNVAGSSSATEPGVASMDIAATSGIASSAAAPEENGKGGGDLPEPLDSTLKSTVSNTTLTSCAREGKMVNNESHPPADKANGDIETAGSETVVPSFPGSRTSLDWISTATPPLSRKVLPPLTIGQSPKLPHRDAEPQSTLPPCQPNGAPTAEQHAGSTEDLATPSHDIGSVPAAEKPSTTTDGSIEGREEPATVGVEESLVQPPSPTASRNLDNKDDKDDLTLVSDLDEEEGNEDLAVNDDSLLNSGSDGQLSVSSQLSSSEDEENGTNVEQASPKGKDTLAAEGDNNNPAAQPPANCPKNVQAQVPAANGVEAGNADANEENPAEANTAQAASGNLESVDSSPLAAAAAAAAAEAGDKAPEAEYSAPAGSAPAQAPQPSPITVASEPPPAATNDNGQRASPPRHSKLKFWKKKPAPAATSDSKTAARKPATKSAACQIL